MATAADYDAWKLKQDELAAGAAKVVVGQEFADKPDVVAYDLTLAEQFGKAHDVPAPPLAVVKQFKPTFQSAVAQFTAGSILDNSPTLAAWLRQPDNAAVAHDDLPALSWWDNLAIVPRGIASAIPAVNEGAFGLLAAAAAIPGKNPVSDYLMVQSKAARSTKENWAGPTGGWLGSQVQGASQSIGLMVPGIVASIASGGSAIPAVAAAYLAPGMVVAGGTSAEKALEAGKGGVQSLVYGATDAAVEGLFERIPVGKLLGDIAEGTGFGKMLMHQLASEVPTEVATTLFQNFNEFANLTPDKPLAEFLAEQPAAVRDTVMQTLLATFGTTGTVAGAQKVFSQLGDRQAKAAQADAAKAAFDEIAKQATSSKLRERMPGKFMDLVAAATAGGPMENMFIPADKFVEYFQSKGMDPAAVAAAIPGVGPTDLQIAIETAADIKIPTASYAAWLAGSDHDAWIKENVRYNPDEFTSAEAKAFNDLASDAMQEAVDLADQLRRDDEELRSVETEIYDTMVSRLRVAGRATDVATSEAMLFPAFYRTMAERSGMTVDEFVAKYPLPQVQGAVPDGMQLKDVTELQRTLATARARRTVGASGGKSLLEFIDSKGGVTDPGGDIAAMDGAVVKRGRGKKNLRIVHKPGIMAGVASMFGGAAPVSNQSIDLMAQAAYEAGYMAHDPRVMAYHAAQLNGGESVDIIPAFLDAIRGELAGSPDFANPDATVAPDGIDTIEEFLSGLGVSLDNTDEEIRAAMERGQSQTGDGAMYAQGSINIASPAFQKWFGDSKVVDENGKPLVVYHGTPTKGIETFRMQEGNYKTEGTGYWFTNSAKAGTYAGDDGEVYASYLKMDRPIVVEWDGHWTSGPAVDYVEYRITDKIGAPVGGRGYFEQRGNAQAQLDRMTAAGEDTGDYEITETPVRGERSTDEWVRRMRRENPQADGIILRNVEGGGDYSAEGFAGLIPGDEYVVFEPTQIKSVKNNGAFDPANPNMFAQPAYHGTPHLFEKFTTDRIGSGEGNQAFGWGLYFAGQKQVAEFYRDKLSAEYRSGDDMKWGGKTALEWYEAADRRGEYGKMMVLESLMLHQPKSEIKVRLEESVKEGDSQAEAGLAYLKTLPAEAFPKTAGRLLTVEIPDDSDLLDTEKTLDKQPPKVKALLRQSGLLKEFKANLSDFASPQNSRGAGRGDNLYNYLTWKLGSDKAASMRLAEIGIPGHRYPAGTIANVSGKGHNYVIYNDAHVNVTAFEQSDAFGFGGGGAPRGMIQFPAAGVGNGETIISTFAGADLSTVVHESGHYFLTVLRDMATKDPSGAIGGDFGAVKDWWHANADAVAKDAMAVVPGVTISGDDVRLAIDAGTSGDALKDQAINVGMQEQFARGFESYLMEGKAPSIELRSAFEKFRAWLISIYRRALGLNVAISDEMRAVFDRLIATDDQITAAKDDAANTAPLFATAEEMGLSPEAYANFRKLYTQANDDAAAKVLASVMAPIRRAATAAYKAERAAVVIDVTKALQNEPMFRAIQELRFGKGFDGKEVPAVKLSREIIEKEYGSGHLGFLPGATTEGKGHRNAVFSDVGGVHPDMVAAMYGFPTGAALLDAIEKAPALAEAINAEVEKEMKTRHSDPLTDGSVERLALQATHNDKRGAVLAAELKALNEVAGYDRGLTVKEARETARRTLRTMAVKDATRSDRFLAAERKAGEAAFALAKTVTREGMWTDAARRKVTNAVSGALRGQDGALALGVNAATDKANANTMRNNQRVGELIEAKRRQLLNHMLYAESLKVADNVDALVAKVGKLNGSDAKLGKVRDVDYVKAARAVAARFGLARGDKAFDFAMWVEQLRVDDPITLDALSQSIATYSQDAKPYKDLTVSEFGALNDAIESLLEVGKRARLLEIDGLAVERDLAISEMQDVLDLRTKTQNDALKAKLTAGQKHKIKALTILSSLRRMENWSRDMDDGTAGVFTKYLVKPVMDALGAYRNDKADRLSALLAIIEPRKADLLGSAIDAPELGYTFENKGEFLHALLHTGNESNLEKLLMGRGWSPGLTGQTQKITANGKASVDRAGNPLMTRGRIDTSKWDALVARMIAEGKLTIEDYQTAQAIWDLMDAIKRPAQSAHRKVFGFYFNEVEPTPVVTPFGTFRGGYVPAIADNDASNDGQIRQDQQALEAQQTSFMFPTTGSGFTKSRVQNYTTPLSLNLMLLPAHMDKVLRFTHLNPVIRQTGAMIAAGPLRASLDAMDKSIATDLIMPWLQRTAQQAVEAMPTTPSGRAASAVFRTLRKRVGVHTMFGNLVNTAQQITGLSSAMVLVKPSRMKAALVRFTKGDGAAMRREASAASPFMRDRIENAGREITGRIQDAIVKPTAWSGIDGFFTKHGYVLQQAAQNLADVIAWHAGYDGAIGKGMTPDEAVFEADSVIRRTMGDFSPENVSMFETGDAFKRLFTMFYSYFNGQANLVGGEMQTTMRTMGWNGKGRMFWIYVFGLAIPAIVGEMIVQAASGSLGADDEDDGYLDEIAQMFFGSQLRYVAGMVPIAGQLTTTMLNKFNNQFYDDRLSTSPVISGVEKAIGAPAAVWDAATGNGSSRIAVINSMALLALVTGIPLGQLSKMAGYAVGVLEGYSHPTNPLDVARGMMSGRDGTE